MPQPETEAVILQRSAILVRMLQLDLAWREGDDADRRIAHIQLAERMRIMSERDVFAGSDEHRPFREIVWNAASRVMDGGPRAAQWAAILNTTLQQLPETDALAS